MHIVLAYRYYNDGIVCYNLTFCTKKSLMTDLGLMDATYWGRNFGVVIMKDSLSGDVLWFKFINRHEHLEDYKEGISYLESLGYTIQDLVCDGFNPNRSLENFAFILS